MTYRYLLGLDDFPPRWHCGKWSEWLGWTHVLADLATWAAYFAIPVVLFYFARKMGKELPFPYLLQIFGVFILACGTNHLLEAVIFWYPLYRVSAFVKVFMAVVSWLAVIVLIDVVPRLLAYPSPEQMRGEIAERTRIQEELQEKTKELARSNDALEAFVNTASHDLKTPIRGMKNLARFVIEDTTDELDETSRQNLFKIIDRADHLEHLVSKLLDYSRVSYEKKRVTLVNVQTMADDIVDLLALPSSFQVNYVKKLPTIRTDEAPLSLVLRNLIANAWLHHDRSDGQIAISWEQTDQGSIFHVSDDGPGIPEEQHDSVFEMFKRFSTGPGDGLGLALAKKAVEESRGRIWLESTVGQGSTFSFSWPDS